MAASSCDMNTAKPNTIIAITSLIYDSLGHCWSSRPESQRETWAQVRRTAVECEKSVTDSIDAAVDGQTVQSRVHRETETAAQCKTDRAAVTEPSGDSLTTGAEKHRGSDDNTLYHNLDFCTILLFR